MQNRYVGDVGDFGKHGLLRFLSGATDAIEPERRLRLGLIWYMHHDERHGANKQIINSDGRHVSYLEATQKNTELYGNCDLDLWSKLRHLVGHDRRCIHCIEQAGILPDDTRYYSTPLTYIPGMPEDKKKELREFWLQCALRKTREADLICVDPDNGIGEDRNKYVPAKGSKYVYMDDLKAIWEGGKSLVVYHHANKTETIACQVGERESHAARWPSRRGANPPRFPPRDGAVFLRDSCEETQGTYRGPSAPLPGARMARTRALRESRGVIPHRENRGNARK